jgi:hypothetical protein
MNKVMEGQLSLFEKSNLKSELYKVRDLSDQTLSDKIFSLSNPYPECTKEHAGFYKAICMAEKVCRDSARLLSITDYDMWFSILSHAGVKYRVYISNKYFQEYRDSAFDSGFREGQRQAAAAIGDFRNLLSFNPYRGTIAANVYISAVNFIKSVLSGA